MNRSKQDMVREFHLKNGYPIGNSVGVEAVRTKAHSRYTSTILLWCVSKIVLMLVKAVQKIACKHQKYLDARLYRLCLIMEEAAEIGLGLSKGDEIEVADGLADLLYVTYGTGVTYYIPLDEVFAEVHRANMSKKTRDEKADPRMRDKGEWTPPAIKDAIECGRQIDYNTRRQSCS